MSTETIKTKEVTLLSDDELETVAGGCCHKRPHCPPYHKPVYKPCYKYPYPKC